MTPSYASSITIGECTVYHYGRTPRAVHYMNLAREHAKRSTCYRLAVGCLVADGKNMVSMGYNGPPSGELHCTGRACPGSSGSCHRSIHAEINAMKPIFGTTLPGMDVFVTHSPCEECTRVLLGHGLNRLFFEVEFRRIDHLGALCQNRPIYQVTSSGYITDYRTKELIDPEGLYD